MAQYVPTTEEHILLCISPSPSNPKVIETGGRMARAFHAKLTALYVEPADGRRLGRDAERQLESNIDLALKAGAQSAVSYGDDVAFQIAEFAKAAAVTKIVIGRSSGNRIRSFVKRDLLYRLAKLLPDMDIYIIPDASLAFGKAPKTRKPLRLSAKSLMLQFGLLAAATLGGVALQALGFSEANIITLYILAVLLTAFLADGWIYGIVSSALSVLVFNFFFTEPRFTLLTYDPGYPLTFLVMFIAATLTSSLTAKARNHAKSNAEKAYRTEVLLSASRNLQQAASVDDILYETAKQLHELLGGVVLLYPVENNMLGEPLVFAASGSAERFLSGIERQAAEWTFQNNKRSGAMTGTFSPAVCQYLAVRGHDTVQAVAGIKLGASVDSFERSIYLAMVGECGLALEKQRSDESKQALALKAQQERLRSNLLRAISHDLRTPLTSISGNADILLRGAVPQAEQKTLYQSIYDDSIWLIDLVENLLSITRMDDRAIQLNLKPELVSDVVDEALSHLGRRCEGYVISSRIEYAFLMARMDAPLIVQVLLNLVENAVKYTPPGSKIHISAESRGDQVLVSVSDNGPGIADEIKPHVFDMFYSGGKTHGDGRRGLGLGLALCKTIVAAHSGEITVKDNTPSGALFTFSLPKEDVKLYD
jgi:two-component system sensor histidine kinase KdpD